MSWNYQGLPINELPEDCVGFVYLITNKLTNRMYVGKKLAKFSKTTVKTVKLKNGNKKKKKIRSKIDSDWQTYYGSNEVLKKDVKDNGHEQFKREILHLCISKGDCGYLEAKEQFVRGVLESDEYYNTWIMCRVRDSHIKDYNVRMSKSNEK